MDTAPLPFRHLLLALAVVAVWGTNFVVIKIGLDDLPPLLFGALRLLLACIPGVFLLPRPQVPWSNLAAYGLLIGAQFGFMFIALRGHISPGLASLVVQMQVFFTIGLAMWLTGERVRHFQWTALALGVAGIVLIALRTDGATTLLGLGLVLLAALGWAGANIVAKRAGGVNMLHYVIWASLFSAPPLFALSLVFEGWDAVRAALWNAGPEAWGAVIWQAVGNTMFGYAAWAWLLSRHPAASISPLAFLIPVFGMGASAFWLGESLPVWKLAAAALVLSGLMVVVIYPRWHHAARPT